MISANYVDGLELRIRELTAERDAALAQNAELVAQVEIVRSGLIDARKWVDERNNVCDKAKDFCDTLTDIIESTPTQCLRDIQAEAGRAGFVEASQYNFTVVSDHFINGHADEYAERVKAGEV